MLAPACLPELSALARAIDAVLPQTQCGRCGYDGCAPYAQAVAQGEAINRCPPGGEEGLVRIAAIVGRRAIALDATLGRPGPLLVAHVDEARCIGCTLCLQACPVDAIVGGAKRMHAVVSALCTGCELCVAPCPVDCIEMAPAGRAWSVSDADAARARYAARNARGAITAPENAATGTPEHAATLRPGAAGDPAVLSADQRRDAIANALARARARRQKTAATPRPPAAQE